MFIIEFLISKPKTVIFTIFIVFLINLVLDFFKWQYYPLIALVFIYLTLVILNYFDKLNLNYSNSKWIIVISLTLILITVLSLLIFPLQKMVKPSGSYKIGTRIYEIEDKSRNEIYGDNPAALRKVKFQVWYPSDNTYGFKKSKWLSDGKLLSRQLASDMRFPPFILDHTENIESNSFINAPVSEALNNYPVVLISHGWRGFREFHTDFAEELASNGFIAISIDHTYGSQLVKFKNGDIAKLNKDALPNFKPPKEFKKYSSVLTKTYGQDVLVLLDYLSELNSADKNLKNKLDLNNIGLLGHSTGGAGMVYAALENDDRVKAIMGLDAWVEPLSNDKLNMGLTIPSLFIRSEQWEDGLNKGSLTKFTKNSLNSNLIQMDKIRHIDFSMTYMFSPITKYIGFTSKLGVDASIIQRELILSFFDKNLNSNSKLSDDYLKDLIEKYDVLNLK